jgi:3-oxoacyl-[acyl-carrier protein] reductase
MSSLRCLVTGAASGIGSAVVARLLTAGHRVLATDVNESALASARPNDGERSGRSLTMRLDVRDPVAWRAALVKLGEAWGGIDVLFNVAGYLQPGYAHEFALEEVDRHLDINVKGVVYGTRLAAEIMVAAGSGHVVNVASMAAFAPIPGLPLYSASKFAVRAFSIAAGMELGPRGVAVSVVCPDAVATPMLDKQAHYEEAALTFTAPRVLTADEVAAALTGEVLRRRPLELALPNRRKWLARGVDLFPVLGPRVSPLFQKLGLRAQRRRRTP